MKNSLTRYRKQFLLPALILFALGLSLAMTAPVRKTTEPALTMAMGQPTPLIREQLRSSSTENEREEITTDFSELNVRRQDTKAERESATRRNDEREHEPERKQDEPDKALEWRRQSMVDEKGQIPDGALLRAWNQARAMTVDSRAWPAPQQSPRQLIAGINPGGWTWLGPGNIGGRIRSIVIHPTNPQTIWIGSVGGGIWKTTNGGDSWSPMSDFLASIAVSTLVIDPNNPNVLYAGTGEGFTNPDSIRGAGVFKTSDGGARWTQLPATANSNWYFVNRLAISPSDSQVILAATATGIWLSSNGGSTWSQKLASRMLDINFNPADGNKCIASGNPGGRYSTDGGMTWNVATGLPASGRLEVAYARSNPAIVYAGAESGSGQLYKSTDGGQSYSLVNSVVAYAGTQGWYDNAVWVDPTNANNVIVGGINLWRSSNGGATFTFAGGLHTDQHAIVESPQFDGAGNKTVYFGNDGGIWRTTDATVSDVTIQSLNNGVGITQFYGGAGNASSGVVIGGTQDNGTLRYTPGTVSWNAMNGGDGGWSASDPTDANYFYGEFQWLQLHRSNNGGLSSVSIYSGITDAVTNGTTNFIAPFILDLNNPNTLLAGGANLWRTTNAKGLVPLGWTIIKPTIGSNISAIAVAKGNSNVIWVGHNDGRVYYTTNGTAALPTWTQGDLGTPGLPNRRCTRITVDPTNQNRVYATFGGFSPDNVWRTDNNGASWTNITANLPVAPVRSLVVWQSNPNYLYVGTEVGVFASADGGQSWSPGNEGPTNCSVDELFWMNDTLVAATHGRGMFSINVTPSSTAAPILLTEAITNRAIALDSVTFVRDPFSLTQAVNFSLDRRTRIMLFALGLELMQDEDISVVSAQAEDSAHIIYPLTVESVGRIPGFDGLTQVNVRLPDGLAGAGDVLVSVSLHGAASNKGSIGIR